MSAVKPRNIIDCLERLRFSIQEWVELQSIPAVRHCQIVKVGWSYRELLSGDRLEIQGRMIAAGEDLAQALARRGESTLEIRRVLHELREQRFRDAFKMFDAMQPYLEALCDEERYDGARSGRSMTVEEANRRAMDLVKGDRFFVQRSQREWAKAIGCSHGLVSKLPLWQETMRLSGRWRKDNTASPKAVGLAALENSIGERDDELQRLIAEQNADAEPSPLEDDPACSQPKRVRCYKRP